MKKLMLLTVLFMSGFTLSGCDLIPTDVVEDLSEELCREDPSNPLCDIEDLSTVEASVAEGLVLDVIDVLNNDTADLCDTVVSITNTDLLDACKDGSLLPEGVTSFTVIKAEQDGNVYVFQGSTGEDSFLEIRVTVGEVEGNVRITSLTTEVIEEPVVPTEELSDEDFILAFILDYQDETVDFDTLNTTYFNGMLSSDDDEERNEFLTAGTTVQATSVTMVETGVYDVSLIFTTGTETETEEATFKIVTTAELRYLEFVDGEDNDCDGVDECTNEEPLTLEMFELLFSTFMQAYTNSAIDNDTLNDTFFNNEAEEDFLANRALDLTAEATFNLVSVMQLDTYKFEVEIERTEGDTTETFPVLVEAELVDGRYVLRFHDGEDNDCDGVEVCEDVYETDLVFVSEFFRAFVADYTNPDVAGTDLVNDYFAGSTEMAEFIAQREEDLTNGLMIQVDLIEPYEEYAVFVVKLTLTAGEESFQQDLKIQVKRIDATTPLLLILDDDDDCDGVDTCDEDYETDLTIVTDFFTAFVSDYLNPDVSDDQLLMDYFANMDMFDVLESRQEDLSSGMMITVDMVEPLEEYGLFLAKLSFTEGEETFYEEIKIKVKRIDAATPMLIFVDDNDNNYEPIFDEVEARSILEMYVMDYNDPFKTNDDLGMKYGIPFDMFWIFEQRTMDQEGGWMLELGNVSPMFEYGDGTYEVTFYANHPDNPQETRVEIVFLVRYQDQAMIMFGGGGGIDDDCDGIDDECVLVTDGEMAVGYLETFLDLYNNPLVSMEELYPYVLDWISLFDHRDKDLMEGIVWSVVSVEDLGDGHFLFALEGLHSEGVVHRDLAARLFNRGSMVVIREDYMPRYDFVTDRTVIDPFVEALFQALNDATMTDDMLIQNYFGWMAPESLLRHRNGGAVFTFVSLLGSDDPMNPNFELTFEATYPDQSVVSETVMVLFHDIENNLFMEVFLPYWGDPELENAFFTLIDFSSNPDIPVEEVCGMFSADSQPLCRAIVSFHRDNGYYSYVEEYYFLEDGSYDVRTVTMNDLGEEVDSTLFHFYRTTDNPLYEVDVKESTNPLYTN